MMLHFHCSLQTPSLIILILYLLLLAGTLEITSNQVIMYLSCQARSLEFFQ